MKAHAWALVIGIGAALSISCKTEGYCFDDCEEAADGATDGSGGSGATGGSGFILDGGDSGDSGGTGAVDGGDGGPCVPSNNGIEICDGQDNDCNGAVDEGITDQTELSKVTSCGTCANNCRQILANTTDPTCEPPSTFDGQTPGTCKFTTCSQDFYDVDPNDPGCEYYCQWNPNGTNTTDPGGADGCGKDDDCDGTVDEDVNTMTDVNNCGACGEPCVLPHATPKCVAGMCEVDTCEAGWVKSNPTASGGCDYQCTPSNGGVEICDGLDNDCDKQIDNADPDLETGDPNLGANCFGSPNGECATPAHQGVRKCVAAQIQCCDVDSNTTAGTNPNLPAMGLRNGVCDVSTGNQVLKPDQANEICNAKDDDCDGQVDDAPTDAGGVCGSAVGNCQTGTQQCQNGSLTCVGSVGANPDICNGQDDNCDGVIDGTLPSGTPVSCTSNSQCTGGRLCLARSGPNDKVCATPPGDAAGACDVPPAAPPGSTTPCMAGTLACVGGSKVCLGSVGPTQTTDECGEDSNCDGSLTGQPDLQNDVKNCGSCGNDCYAAASGHGIWSCVSGACQRSGCETGYIECGGGSANDCETACAFTSNNESCNGLDDNCNCQIDEAVATPTPDQVCGVATGVTDPKCQAGNGTNGVLVACQNGGWDCTFPTGYCTNGDCSTTADVCDNQDNNCNGNTDDPYAPPLGLKGQPCASDDGLPFPGHGACRTTGIYACTGPNTVACNATKNNAAAGPELCDGVDNDCDTVVDEPFNSKGANTTYFVKPAVARIASSLWVYQYEASRPAATAVNPGSGNGYQTSAPPGVPLDKTPSCSEPGVVPWFNVTPTEAMQTCTSRGGRICNRADWQTACHASVSCTYGYAPRASCNSTGNYPSGTRTCNIGPFDFNTSLPGIQDGLLPTAAGSLSNCWSDWTGLQGQTSPAGRIYDAMGNLREITRVSNTQFTLMGGAFNTQVESGATCDFTFFNVDENYKLYDVGFRCCFDADPRL